MKHTALIICLLFATQLFGQNVDENPSKRKIIVSGYAEIELEPSTYLIEVNLRESYEQSNYQQTPKVLVSLDSLEIILKKYLDDFGFDSKKLSEIYVGSYTNGYNGRDINLVTGNYEYKLKNYSEMRKFIKNIKFVGMAGIRVRRFFDVNKEATESKLYADALKNAKSKAQNLLITANDSIGEILNINMNSSYQAVTFDDPYNFNGNWGSSGMQDIMRRKIISTSMMVTFEIK